MGRLVTAIATTIAAFAATLTIVPAASAAEGTIEFEVLETIWTEDGDFVEDDIKTIEIEDPEPLICHAIPEDRTGPDDLVWQELFTITNNTDAPLILVEASCEEVQNGSFAGKLEVLPAGGHIHKADLAEGLKNVVAAG